MKPLKIYLLTLLAGILLSFGCKKNNVDPHIPPDLTLKTDAPYTSADKTVNKGDTILVGIVVTKTEDDLKSFNVSYFYDGATMGTTYYNYLMSDTEKSAYSKDIKIVTRKQAGTEKWVFTILDRDGNMTQRAVELLIKN